MHRLGAKVILLFKIPNFKYQWEDSMDVVQFFLVCFRIRTVQGRNGVWRGFFSYLNSNLANSFVKFGNLPEKQLFGLVKL